MQKLFKKEKFLFMDPITQATFGGIFAQAFSSKKKIVAASLVGIIAGLSPDLDVFIRSGEDPLFSLEYHRQFTHSLIFIPFGALIVTVFTRLIFFKSLSFFENYIFAILGYATHGFLDACTSYGTLLMWPFSNERYAWNNISIIDPLLTIPILILLTFTIIFKKKLFSIISVCWIFIYLGFGIFQNFEATKLGIKLAESRNHNYKKLIVKPSFGNLFLWKIVYLHEEDFFVDAVNLLGEKKFCYGVKIPKLDLEKHYLELEKGTKQYKDVKRFDWFSKGYLGYDKSKNMITDVRYSAVPNEVDGLWGIKINEDPNYLGHVEWVANRSHYKESWLRLSKILFGNECNKLNE